MNGIQQKAPRLNQTQGVFNAWEFESYGIYQVGADLGGEAYLLATTDGAYALFDTGFAFCAEQTLNNIYAITGGKPVDYIVLTHSHYDHVGGIDDLRAYCAGREFPVYAQADVIDGLRQRLPYCFAEHPYPGVPRLSFSEIKANVPFSIGDVEITPIPVMHYKLPILGFRIGPLAYITDAKTIDTEQLGTLKGIPLLVINSLRIEPHMSHYCLRETLDVIDQIKPQRALLTHMSHEMGLHAQVNRMLPPGVELAHDTLTVSIED